MSFESTHGSLSRTAAVSRGPYVRLMSEEGSRDYTSTRALMLYVYTPLSKKHS